VFRAQIGHEPGGLAQHEVILAQTLGLTRRLLEYRDGPEARSLLVLYAEVVHPGGLCVPSPVALPDELHDQTVAPDAEMGARKKYRTFQEEIPDSPGRNTGLPRKKYRTLQEETLDSPGRNTGLSR
jgi:hypothetical protein